MAKKDKKEEEKYKEAVDFYKKFFEPLNLDVYNARIKNEILETESSAKDAVDKFIEENGSFYDGKTFEHNKFPFYKEVCKYQDILNSIYGGHVSFGMTIIKLGYKNFSETFLRYQRIGELENYKDDDGFLCDEFGSNATRKQPKNIYNYIRRAADTANVELPVFVTLFCNQKKKSYVFQGDRIQDLINQLIEHQEKYGSIEHLRSENPSLDGKVKKLGTKLMSDQSRNLQKWEVLEFLNSYAGEKLFETGKERANKNVKDRGESYLKVAQEVRKIAEENDGVVKLEDLRKVHIDGKTSQDGLYRDLLDIANRMGTYVVNIVEEMCGGHIVYQGDKKDDNSVVPNMEDLSNGEKKVIERVKQIGKEHGGKVSVEILKANNLEGKSTSEGIYADVKHLAQRHKTTEQCIIEKVCNLRYVINGKGASRLSNITVTEVPGLDKMIAKRDEILKENGVTSSLQEIMKNKDVDAFQKWFRSCIESYRKYDKIYHYDCITDKKSDSDDDDAQVEKIMEEGSGFEK